MNKLTKVVNGREVKKTKVENVKEESSENSVPDKTTPIKKSNKDGVVHGFTGTGGAGVAGSMDTESSDPDKN